MKFLFRWAFRLLILAIVLGIGLILTKDTILKEFTVSGIRTKTGMDARIGKLETGTLNPTVRMENLTLFNTAEFGGSPILTIPDLYVEYDADALGSQRVHFNLMRLEIAELHIIENEQGRTNIHQLLGVLGGAFSPDSRSKKQGNGSTFSGIDKLNLSVHKIKYTNLRNPRRSQEYVINMKNEVVSNLRSQEDLYGVLLKVFLRAGITLYLQDRVDASPKDGKMASKLGKNR